MIADLFRVLRVLPRVELGRMAKGPAPLVQRLRADAPIRPRRDSTARARLRRAIHWVDRFMPGGGNCYRRVLLEMALDAGAAQESLHLGIRRQGGKDQGHAWLGQRNDAAHYDAELSI